jgi:large subunit ribosomal protein L9
MAVKIILRQTVENLGKPGDIVKVKPGYAYNYLIPQQYALSYTVGNVRRIENEKRVLAVREAKMIAEAKEVAAKFDGTKLIFQKKCGLEGVLYGSVTPAEVAEAITAKGLETDKKHILLAEPIKRLGAFSAKIRLHPEVTLELKITVKSEDGLAETHMAEKAAEAERAAAEPAEVSTEKTDDSEATEVDSTEEEAEVTE